MNERAERSKRSDRKRGYSTRKKKRTPWNKGTINYKNKSASSTSARKLLSSKYPVSNYSGYRIFDLDILKNILSNTSCCKFCGGSITLAEVRTFGLGGDYQITCQDCKHVENFSSCSKIGPRNKIYELNHRVVLASRLAGNGLANLSLFCGIMDLPPPVSPSAFYKIQRTLLRAANDEADDSMKKAVEEEINVNSEIDENSVSDDSDVRKIKVKGDGTWQKRGFKSLNGAVSIIGSKTEKVIDIEVLTSHCAECNNWTVENGPPTGEKWEDWYSVHKLICKRNYSGSAGGMESTGIVRIFKRSTQKYNVQYTHYIGDGDTKTFHSIIKASPYGPDVVVKKLECVGHVGKRFGYRMRKLKEDLKGKKLSDEKGLTGKGRLSDKVIVNLQTYYSGAIRNNPKTLSGMIRDIWAIWYHVGSTDESPQHQFCPVGRSSWCKYQRAKALNNLSEFHHKNALPKAVVEAIRPVFVEMSSVSLLKRCLGGHTQNSNESFNSVLWRMCPKNTFVGLDTLQFGSQVATVLFNDGMAGVLRIMQRSGVNPGANAISAARKKDIIRIRKAERESMLDAKKKRHIYKRLRINLLDDNNEEGPDYQPGAF